MTEKQKKAWQPGGADLPIGDRLNMVFAATTVQKGRATAVVATTGLHTQIGRIADSLRTTEPEKPPLVRRTEVFSKKISLIILGACVLLGIIGYMSGMQIGEIFFLMVAVGVSAIPEGLPVGLTVALSIGTRRMAARNVIVRKLPADHQHHPPTSASHQILNASNPKFSKAGMLISFFGKFPMSPS